MKKKGLKRKLVRKEENGEGIKRGQRGRREEGEKRVKIQQSKGERKKNENKKVEEVRKITKK